jgi:hypothetical protein
MRSTILFLTIITVLAVVFVTTGAEAEDKVLTCKNPGAKNRNSAVRVDDAIIVISGGKAQLSFGVVAMSERCTPQGNDAPWLTIKLLGENNASLGPFTQIVPAATGDARGVRRHDVDITDKFAPALFTAAKSFEISLPGDAGCKP